MHTAGSDCVKYALDALFLKKIKNKIEHLPPAVSRLPKQLLHRSWRL